MVIFMCTKSACAQKQSVGFAVGSWDGAHKGYSSIGPDHSSMPRKLFLILRSTARRWSS